MKKLFALKSLSNFLLVIITQISILSGCQERKVLTAEEVQSKRQDTCRVKGSANVFKIQSPSRGRVNEVINVDAFIILNGNCTTFLGFESTQVDNNTQLIKANVQSNRCGPCTMNFVEASYPYKFKAGKPGTYYLEFQSTADTYLVDTLFIN